MAIIKLYDYSETVDDGWFGTYEQFYYIGQGKLSATVVVPLIESVPDNEEINVKINSGGGYVFDGWAIYNALIAAKSRGCKVIVNVDGIAASIASIIAMAGDEIIMAKASLLMIHKPTVDLWCCGSVDSAFLKKEADALDQIQAVLISIYQSKSNLDSEAINSLVNTETWITPDNAVLMGFATSVSGTTAESKITLSENSFKNIFKNADVQTRTYANSIINIHKIKNMADNNETIAAVKEQTKATNGLLAFFKNLIPGSEEQPTNNSKLRDDGSSIYFDGELAVGTKVFTDEAMTIVLNAGDHLMEDKTILVIEGEEGIVSEIKTEVIEEDTDETATLNARIAELEAENTSLKAENKNLNTSLSSANTSLTQANAVLSKFKDTKSTFVPPAKEQSFTKTKEQENAKPDLSKEAREARKKEIANKNKAK